jgi:hypothetical protein
MRRRVEIKQKKKEMERRQEELKKQKEEEEEQLIKNQKGQEIDLSNYIFDNITGKVVDIDKDFGFAQIAKETRKNKFKKDMITKAVVVIPETAVNQAVLPGDLPVRN